MTATQVPLPKNTACVDAITDALTTGLKHPGNPTDKTPPATILLPMFRTRGLPPPMVDAAKGAAKTVAESCVWLIENDLDHTIILNTELARITEERDQAREELRQLREAQAIITGEGL